MNKSEIADTLMSEEFRELRALPFFTNGHDLSGDELDALLNEREDVLSKISKIEGLLGVNITQ